MFDKIQLREEIYMKNYCSIKKYRIQKELSRIFLVLCGAVLMAINLNTFVHSAGLLPGGFTGITLLLQEVFQKFLGYATLQEGEDVLVKENPRENKKLKLF